MANDVDSINRITREHLVNLIYNGGAHATIEEALDDLPAKLRGIQPDGLPYSIWQLVEHIRIAQWDILKFVTNKEHISPKWPDDYWVKEPTPKDEEEWGNSIEQIYADRQKFIDWLIDPEKDLYEPFEGENGQTLLREALLIADHASYHIGEIIMIRRLLGAWKNK